MIKNLSLYLFIKTIIGAILIIILTLIFNVSGHTDDRPSITLNQGDKAPYPGVLVDIARVQRIDTLQLDYDHLVKVSSLKDQDIEILNDRIENANQSVKDLSSKLTQTDNSSHTKEIIMFCLGAVITGTVSYGLYRVSK